MESIVKNYTFSTKNKGKRTPQVVTGFLPPKRSNGKEEPDYPFVIVRLLGGADNNSEATVKVKIIVGTYSNDSNGWRDTASLIHRIYTELFKKRIISKRYECDGNIEFNLPEEQVYPYWLGELVTTWTIPHPVLEGFNIG